MGQGRVWQNNAGGWCGSRSNVGQSVAATGLSRPACGCNSRRQSTTIVYVVGVNRWGRNKVRTIW